MTVPTLTVPADHRAVQLLGSWLRGLLGDLDPREAAWLHPRLELAAHEVCVNVLDHALRGAGGTLNVDGWVSEDKVRLRVVDIGDQQGAERAYSRSADEPDVSGYGLTIVERLMDELSYEHRDGRNTWWLGLARSPERRVDDDGSPAGPATG